VDSITTTVDGQDITSYISMLSLFVIHLPENPTALPFSKWEDFSP